MTAAEEKPSGVSGDAIYHAFLVRCWREGESWRFTLETVGPTRQQRQGFVGYEQLSAFLNKQFVQQDGDPGSEQKEGGAAE